MRNENQQAICPPPKKKQASKQSDNQSRKDKGVGKRYEVEATVKVCVDFEYEDDGSGLCIEDQIFHAIEEQDGYPTFCEIEGIDFDYSEVSTE